MNDIDLQVNGYGGVDFNQNDLSLDGLRKACELLRADGVEWVLATIITADFADMCTRLRRLAELREQDPLVEQVIRGLHVEGPFLNPIDGYRGAHPAEAMTEATPERAAELLDAGRGLVKLVTLAPEHDPGFATTKFLSKRGVVVSAGHCNPSLDQLRGAADAGLSMFTHLGNGCPMNMNRHDNIVQRALSLHENLWLCFIADGVHVPFFALRNYLNAIGLDRAVVVTDAVAPAGLGPGRYTVAHWDLDIGEDLVARAPDGSHLIGSAINMPRVRENLATHLRLDAKQIHTLIRDNPRAAMGA